MRNVYCSDHFLHKASEMACTLAGSGDRAALAAAEGRICRTVIVDSAPGLSGPAITAAEQSCARL